MFLRGFSIRLAPENASTELQHGVPRFPSHGLHSLSRYEDAVVDVVVSGDREMAAALDRKTALHERQVFERDGHIAGRSRIEDTCWRQNACLVPELRIGRAVGGRFGVGDLFRKEAVEREAMELGWNYDGVCSN